MFPDCDAVCPECDKKLHVNMESIGMYHCYCLYCLRDKKSSHYHYDKELKRILTEDEITERCSELNKRGGELWIK